MNKMDFTDICRILHLTTAEYTFFLEVHGKFSKTDHILGHKMTQQIQKKKNPDIIPYILSDDNGMKLEINTKRTVLCMVKHIKQYTFE